MLSALNAQNVFDFGRGGGWVLMDWAKYGGQFSIGAMSVMQSKVEFYGLLDESGVPVRETEFKGEWIIRF